MPHPLEPTVLNALNLKVLRRHCPQIKDIYDQASYVVLYRSILKHPEDPESKEREWSKKDVHVEGSMFLVEYETSPPHGFYILNREGLSDFKHVFRAGDKFEYKSDFVIFQGEGSAEIWGLWIFEEDQRKRLAKKFLYYHQLEVDPSTAAPSDPPILLPNGKPQPQTVDELFQNLLTLPPAGSTTVSSPGTVTSSISTTPIPTAPVLATGPPTRALGRRRGESVSTPSQEPQKQILTASTGPGGVRERGRDRERERTDREGREREGKGKKQRRPKSVPPQQADEPSVHAHGVPPHMHMPQQWPAQEMNGQAVVQDPSVSLKQIFGLLPGPAPAAPTPPQSSLLSQTQPPAQAQAQTQGQGQGQGSTACPGGGWPPLPGGVDKIKEGREGKGHGRKKSALQSQIQIQIQPQPQSQLGLAQAQTPTATQYIPQPGLNGESLVDPESVKEAIVEKMLLLKVNGEAEPGAAGKACSSQREFVQEVLRLIHTEREWTRELWEAYERRVGGEGR
ncbi:hypothetical protein DACRYDRAFT_101377 [Dacryopinax primogenitus]|uniref:PH domain-like protein n=1 Tax=Dacryopinax primogenitus (strain DJM 731) TaxID=1858805 RepID=M5FUR2_DACPD|nr:uncharacterized protein DACRYDRAFT_101377 [Dacryopinax primogenitus]EJT99229.1 hypothetical protein DACRYDRAFT_101377 [Dacryopinax primogenitus]